MKFVDGVVPEEFQPSDSEHIRYDVVYRFVKKIDFGCESFTPYVLDNPNACKQFARQEKPEAGHFAVSLYDSIEHAIDALKKFKRLQNVTLGIAVGFTDFSKGISTERDAYTGHIDYFLYDWKNNTPAVDFEFQKKNEDLLCV